MDLSNVISAEENSAHRRPKETVEMPHQSRLAGAVLADYRHRFAGLDPQTHLSQGRRAVRV
jgi:hypothetical protein